MKYFSLIAIFVIFSSSCISTNQTHKGSDDQARFSEYLQACEQAESKCLNDIQRDEYMEKFEHALAIYVDSVVVFNNWKCKITNISRTNSEEYKIIDLTFRLEVEPRQYQRIAFDVSYIMPIDSIETDSIYQVIRNLNEYSDVYVDGFIPTKKDHTVKYSGYISDNFAHLNMPEYRFKITSISKTSKPMSAELKCALSLLSEQLHILRSNYWKELSDKKEKILNDSITPLFEAAKKKLSPYEVKYLNIYGTQFANEFLD